MYDIAIIGAGVVGGMVASALSKYDINFRKAKRRGNGRNESKQRHSTRRL